MVRKVDEWRMKVLCDILTSIGAIGSDLVRCVCFYVLRGSSLFKSRWRFHDIPTIWLLFRNRSDRKASVRFEQKHIVTGSNDDAALPSARARTLWSLSSDRENADSLRVVNPKRGNNKFPWLRCVSVSFLFFVIHWKRVNGISITSILFAYIGFSVLKSLASIFLLYSVVIVIKTYLSFLFFRFHLSFHGWIFSVSS